MEKYLNNNKTLIISHLADVDGMGSIILGKLAFKEFDYLLIHINEEKEILKYLSKIYTNIYICDIPLEKEIADKINSLNLNIHHFDHHGTNTYANKYSFSNVMVNFNNHLTCGTELFYNYLVTNNLLNKSSIIDEFVELVREYDTWDFKIETKENAHNLTILFEIMGYQDFINHIETLLTLDKFALTNADNEMIKYRNQEIKDLITSINANLIRIKYNNYSSALIFSNKYQSDIGNEICLLNKDLDFVFILDINLRKASLRSLDMDVSLIAQKYGGGGHPHASGFYLNDDNMKEILNLLINHD